MVSVRNFKVNICHSLFYVLMVMCLNYSVKNITYLIWNNLPLNFKYLEDSNQK